MITGVWKYRGKSTRGRISGAENIVKNDAAHFCVTQGKKMQIVDLKTEGAGLHGVARLTFKCGE
ncbi:hypothetical protein BZL70_12155 [Escherichia coli]|nr:hypothetical protein BZL70_12155 [Escherichia coli]